MRVLVLGSNSFLGSSFIAHLLGNTDHEVIATSRSEQASTVFLPYLWTSRRPVQFHQIDLNSDQHLLDLDNLLDEWQPTHVVNFAAQSMVAESWVNPYQWMRTNVVALSRMLDGDRDIGSLGLRRCDWLEKYVHVTTPEVYGSNDEWVTEDWPFNPTTPYAVSRAAGDMLLATSYRQYEFPVVFVRPGNVYGPGQRPYRIVAKTILATANGGKLVLDGGGTSERAFIHADDVSDALLRVAEKGRLGECYHISGYELVTIRKIVKKVLKRLFRDFDKCVTIGPERPGLDAAYKMDSVKIRCELGWRDRISLDDGIADVIQWTRRFERELADVPLEYQHKP